MSDKHGLRPRDCKDIRIDVDSREEENGDLLDNLLEMRIDAHF